jgi:hypothetical protein
MVVVVVDRNACYFEVFSTKLWTSYVCQFGVLPQRKYVAYCGFWWTQTKACVTDVILPVHSQYLPKLWKLCNNQASISLFVTPTETKHLRDISVRYQCCMQYYFYTQHRYLSVTPLSLHTPSVTLNGLPSEVKPLVLGSQWILRTPTANSDQKSPLIWTPWLSNRTRQQSSASSLFDANMEDLSGQAIQQ